MDYFSIFSSICKYILVFIIYGFIYRITKSIFLSTRERSQSVKAKLIITGPMDEKVFFLSDMFTIGRMKENDFIIQDETISKYHVQIRRINRGYQIVDLKSANGTFVNGEKVQMKQLHDGDVISIGRWQLVYEEIKNHEK